MLTLFWDERGVILEHHMPRGNTVSSATYADLLKNHLRPAIKSKRRGLPSIGVLLQHDNPQPHTAGSTVAKIQDLCPSSVFHIRRTLQTSPPNDFHVFGPLKKAIGGKSFRSDESRRCMSGCALNQKTFFFSRGIHALPKRWNTCMQ